MRVGFEFGGGVFGSPQMRGNGSGSEEGFRFPQMHGDGSVSEGIRVPTGSSDYVRRCGADLDSRLYYKEVE